MPRHGSHGDSGYTFDIVDLTTASAVSKVFELRSKSSRGSLGLVRWSSPHRAYIFCPDPNVLILTHQDLRMLNQFVSRQNSKEAARRLAIRT